jgi:serine/threonine protein kinase
VRSALNRNTKERPTAAELLKHSWIEESKKSMVAKPLSPKLQQQFINNMKNFSKLTKFQTGIISILANLTASEEDLQKLKKIFAEIDFDGDGSLTLAEV